MWFFWTFLIAYSNARIKEAAVIEHLLILDNFG
jgi:hypothetical protein